MGERPRIRHDDQLAGGCDRGRRDRQSGHGADLPEYAGLDCVHRRELPQRNEKAGLGYAALQNQAGKFVLPTESNIGAAAAATDKATPPDERISLIFAPGENSYPIINYEYAIVNPKQGDPAKAAELKKFLDWALTDGQSSKVSRCRALPPAARIDPEAQPRRK